MVTTRAGAMVIMAAAHNDDAHVFPALRAGANNYIFKVQLRKVDAAPLCRIDWEEPALSPPIALRMLKNFHAGPNHGIKAGDHPVVESGTREHTPPKTLQ